MSTHVKALFIVRAPDAQYQYLTISGIATEIDIAMVFLDAMSLNPIKNKISFH